MTLASEIAEKSSEPPDAIMSLPNQATDMSCAFRRDSKPRERQHGTRISHTAGIGLHTFARFESL